MLKFIFILFFVSYVKSQINFYDYDQVTAPTPIFVSYNNSSMRKLKIINSKSAIADNLFKKTTSYYEAASLIINSTHKFAINSEETQNSIIAHKINKSSTSNDSIVIQNHISNCSCELKSSGFIQKNFNINMNIFLNFFIIFFSLYFTK